MRSPRRRPCLPAARLQLAAVVQYLPLPAVGGYLSYVGYFCLASGLGLGCGIQLGSAASWTQLWDAQVRRRGVGWGWVWVGGSALQGPQRARRSEERPDAAAGTQRQAAAVGAQQGRRLPTLVLLQPGAAEAGHLAGGQLSFWLTSYALAHSRQVALRVLPTLGSCALMMWTMARFRHPLALPAVLLAIVALFHAALLALGVSLQEAQEAGWVMKPAVSPLPCSSACGVTVNSQHSATRARHSQGDAARVAVEHARCG